MEEVLGGARRDGLLARRWYSSNDFDLYVWRESTHEIVQFQLFWKRPTKIHDADHIPEEAVTWTRDTGIVRAQVAEAGRYKAPILIGTAGAGVAIDELVEAFIMDTDSSNYPGIQFVMAKLETAKA